MGQHGDDLLLESEPEWEDMLEGLARHFDVKCLDRRRPGFRAEGRFLKRCVSWGLDCFVWHGGPAKVGQFIALMETAGCRSSAAPGSKATGHGRRNADQKLECTVMKLAQRASWLIMYISMDWPDLQFSSKTVLSREVQLLCEGLGGGGDLLVWNLTVAFLLHLS